MPQRVLITTPENLSVPWFKINRPGSRENSEAYLDLESELPRMIGGNASRWILDRKAEGIRLVRMSTFSPPKSRVWSYWLEFDRRETAINFLSRFKRLGMEAISEQVRAEHMTLSEKLARDVANGRYDLSRLPASARANAASRYVTASERLNELRDALLALERVSEAVCRAEAVQEGTGASR